MTLTDKIVKALRLNWVFHGCVWVKVYGLESKLYLKT